MSPDEKVRRIAFAEIARANREAADEVEAVNWLLKHMLGQLHPESATAKAIARRAPWSEILDLALWEEADEVIALLERAKEKLGSKLPKGVWEK